MQTRPSESRTVEIDADRGELAALAAEVQRSGTHYVLVRDGEVVAALVTAEEERRLGAQREQAFQVLADIRAAFAAVPDADLKREIKQAITEARAELYPERGQQSQRSL